MATDAIAAADALGAGIHARSTDLIGKIYADDVVVWHASTGTSATKEGNLALLGGVFTLTSRLEYRDIRRHLIDGGVVQQHQLVGAFADGRPLPVLETCMVIKVRNGLITRIDEYFDGQTYAELWAQLAALSA
jgi:ketosteroid isomerase-like protein